MSRDHKSHQSERLDQSADEQLRDNGGTQNAAPSRGGTTDMDDEALTVDRTKNVPRGSGATTKNTVTGSDFDGQVA